MPLDDPDGRQYRTRDATIAALDRQRPLIQIALAGIILLLAALRLLDVGGLGGRIDSTLLLLIVAAGVILVAPWDRLASFKGGGVEVTWSVQTTQVRGAIHGLKLDETVSKTLESKLWKLREEVEAISGSRVLWIDDKPHEILGERRILRALGVRVTSAISSDEAKGIIHRDNDFDVIITDAQRANLASEGTKLIAELDQHSDQQIRSIPVVFYAAFPMHVLIDLTRDIRRDGRRVELTNSVDELVSRTVELLADVRKRPITCPVKKTPT